MKTDKQFIDEIYKKYEEYSKENKKPKYIQKITNIAAVIIVVLSAVFVFSGTSLQENKISQNGKIQETKIQLKTIGSFENFYNTIKQNYKLTESDGLKNTVQDLNREEISSYKTNTQEENVDESDIVKVNGNYIYYVSNGTEQSKIVIIDAQNAENSAKISEIDYTSEVFRPREIYVNKDKLVVIGNETESVTQIRKTIENDGTYDIALPPESKTGVIIYDISNPKEPKEIRRVMVSGNYLNSRMIDNNIYLTATRYIYTSNLIKNNIEDLNENDYMPKYIDTAISEEEKCIPYNDIYYFDKTENTNYLILMGVNLETGEEADIQTFLGAGEYTYSSEKNMYIATSNFEYDEKYQMQNSTTHILKFALNNGKFRFQAETDIQGVVNNQFSMDENGEYFRIATTSGEIWNINENTSNNLYILNNNLEKVGEITGFAQEEKIYSVRYTDDKAYVVTFKQTDPLFVIDLSTPTSPQILGELKIPGYSTYLQPYDETHVIGFGYDTNEKGTTTGLKLSMFDISDLNNPKEMFTTKIGNRYTSSELTYNHKSLLYIKNDNIIAFPVIYYNSSTTRSTIPIYKIDLEKGFVLQGEISHESNKYEEQIERVVYVGNAYYTMSRKMIKVVDMTTLQQIKEIEI